jgi:hypothetical protein
MKSITWAVRKVGKGIQKVVPDYLPGLSLATAAAARKGSHIIKPLPEWKMGSKEIEFARSATPKGMRRVLRFIARYSLWESGKKEIEFT